MKKLFITLCLSMALVFCFSQIASAALWAVQMTVEKVYVYTSGGTEHISVTVSWNSGAVTRGFPVDATLSDSAQNRILATLLTAQSSGGLIQADVSPTNTLLGVMSIQ